MCEPTTIAATALAVGGGVQAYGQRQEAKYNAAVAKTNQQLAEISAQDALDRGAQEASRYRVQVRSLQGEQRAAIAASGVEQSGSALRILADTAAIGEMDIATIRNNAAREAFGFRTQGLNYGAQAQLDKLRGRYQPAATILGTAGNVYSTYKLGV